MSDSDASFKSKAKGWVYTTLGLGATWLVTQFVPFLKPYVSPEAIGGYFKATWAFLGSASSLPNWVVGLIGLFALLGLVIVVLGVYSLIRKEPEQPLPPWASYTEDTIESLRWRWRYIDNTLTDPVPYCPHCDYQVDYNMGHRGYGQINSFYFHCDNCKQDLAGFLDDFDTLVRKVKRKIDLNIRTRSKNQASTPK